MKKVLSLFALVMALSVFTSCGRPAGSGALSSGGQDITAQTAVSGEAVQALNPLSDESGSVWTGTWACAQYYGDNTGDAGKRSALNASDDLPDSTLRQIIRVSAGGGPIRLTFSNEYGETPMTVRAVHIAKATKPARSDIDVSTDTPVTFDGGAAGTVIPAGERAVSDPVDFNVKALERIAVSIYFGEMPETVSCHVASRANSFIQAGDALSAETLSGSVNTHWFVLCGADILSPPKNKSVVALGDSITDGYGVSDEQYSRWTDILAERLQENPETSHISVINMGIGTNKMINQTNPPAAEDRFSRDVLEQPGVGYLVFLIGVNDLAGLSGVNALTEACDEMIKAASERGIKVYGGTILPNGPNNDDVRQAFNGWLRGRYADGVIHGLADFDEALKDPDNPQAMSPVYNNDGTHPSAAGYKAMGEYVYSLIEADIAGNSR